MHDRNISIALPELHVDVVKYRLQETHSHTTKQLTRRFALIEHYERKTQRQRTLWLLV